jgi:hypothetical protein
MQLGLAHPVALSGLSRREMGFLASLEGRKVGISVSESNEFLTLIETLQKHDLLIERNARSCLPESVLRLRGVDAISQPLVTALAMSGLGALSIVDPRPSK